MAAGGHIVVNKSAAQRAAQRARVRSLLNKTQTVSSWADKMSFTAETLLSDLDRCPHGRHMGDVCSGWRGPELFAGGCRGGVSLGNPLLPPGRIIGTNLSRGFMIRMPHDRNDRHDPRAWYVPLSPDNVEVYEEAVERALVRNIEDGLDG